MESKGYISDLRIYFSELSGYQKNKLGNVEKYFLNEIMAGHKSAYKLFSILKRRGRKMAYKNVHRRVMRLKQLNLIEEVKGEFDRGAKNYQLSTCGLFYLISQLVYMGSLRDLLNKFNENIIFKTLLHPYFEKETLSRASIRLYFAILGYLQDCYDDTLEVCQKIRSARKEKDKEKYFKQLEVDLQWRIRSLVFKLVTKNDELYRHMMIVSEEEQTSKIHHSTKREAIALLSKDKKFMDFLEVVQKEFEDGCKELKPK